MKNFRDMTEPELKKFCYELAKTVEDKLPPGPSFNGKAFFFLMFDDEGGPGIAQYVSNAERSGAIKMLRETADRLEKNQDVVR